MRLAVSTANLQMLTAFLIVKMNICFKKTNKKYET